MNNIDNEQDATVDIVLCGNLASAVLPNSKVYKCAQCGEQCAASAHGQSMIDKGAKPFCFECGLKVMQGNKKPEFVYSGQAMQSLLEHLKSERDN